MFTICQLSRTEIPLIWTIDRSEVIENIYTLEHGALVLRPEHFEATGWPPGEEEIYRQILLDCFDRGGWFRGLFDGDKLAVVAVLESKFIGPHQSQTRHCSGSNRKTFTSFVPCDRRDLGDWVPVGIIPPRFTPEREAWCTADHRRRS